MIGVMSRTADADTLLQTWLPYNESFFVQTPSSISSESQFSDKLLSINLCTQEPAQPVNKAKPI